MGIALFLVIPFYFQFDFVLFSNKDNGDSNDSDNIFFAQIHSIIVIILVIIQSSNLLRRLKPSLEHSSKTIVSCMINQGSVRECFLLKTAASTKLHKLVKNALDLHFDEGGKGISSNLELTQTSTNSLALLNYSKSTERTETVGGLLWCWKSYISRSIVRQEGIVVNSRLLLCNLLQLLLIIITCYFLPSIATFTVAPAIFPSIHNEIPSCDNSTFDPDKCKFLNYGQSFSAGVGVCYGVKVVRLLELSFLFVILL